MDLNSSKVIRIKAMDYLGRRDHSKGELFKKMRNKVDSLELLQEELDKLEMEGYINEQRFAEEYIRSRVIRGYGPIRIESELRTKGLKDGTISISLMKYDGEWVSAAVKAVLKKFSSEVKAYKDQKILLKKKRFLAYRGFNFDHINNALENIRLENK